MSNVIRLNALEAVVYTYPGGKRVVKAQTQNRKLIQEIENNLALARYDHLSTEQLQSLHWLLDHFKADEKECLVCREAIHGIGRERLERMLSYVNESVGCTYPHSALIEMDETHNVGRAAQVGNMIYQIAYQLRNDLIELEQRGQLPEQATERYGILQSKMMLAEGIIENELAKGTQIDLEG